MHVAFDVVAVLILVTATAVRLAMVRRRDGDRSGDPDSQVRASGQETVEVVVRNPSGVVLLVSADCRRPSPLVSADCRRPTRLAELPLVRHPQSGLRKRSARRRERLRTVDSFLGAVPPHGVERWTVPVPPHGVERWTVPVPPHGVERWTVPVPPHGVERWTVPVPPRAARLYLVLSQSKRRVLLHDHPIPVPAAPSLAPLRP